MKKIKIISNFMFLLSFLAPVLICQEALALKKEDKQEFEETEIFDKNIEEVEYFIGQYKDFPDPEFNANITLKIPNQEDIEVLFKYLRKYIDSLAEGGPNPEAIKQNIFMDDAGNINMNKLLAKFRFKPIFKDVSFSINELTFNKAKGIPGVKPVRYMSLFNNLILDDAEFEGVKLDDVDFSGSKLTNINISDSNFNRFLCIRCVITDVRVDKSLAKDADFSFSTGKSITFNDSNISYLKFTDAHVGRITFAGGTLENSNFINSGYINIYETKTYSNIFDNSAPDSLPIKTIGLVYKNNFPGGTAYKVLQSIRNHNLESIKIEYGLEKFLNEEKVQAEVIAIMKKALDLLDDKDSLAQRFLKIFNQDPNAYPEIARMAKMTKGYVDKLDGLIIPGGLDVEPYFFKKDLSAEDFYGDKRARLKGLKNIETEDFPIRTVLELFLINMAAQKGIPMLLLCRGAHIYNIFKDGDMIENLPDVYDDVNFDAHLRYVDQSDNLTPDDKKQKIYELFAQQEGPIGVYGNHHQALDPAKLGKDLRTLLVWKLPRENFIPYALYDKNYKPEAWLFQFHPEVKEEMGGAMSRQLSELNSQVYDEFFKLVNKPKEAPSK